MRLPPPPAEPLWLILSFQSENLSRSAEASAAAHGDFEQMLLVAHYCATRAAARGVAPLVRERTPP